MVSKNKTSVKLLKVGNAKLDKSILVFSLPPVKTCPNCDGCKNDCYALKSWRQYPNVRDSWTFNYEVSQDSQKFIEAISSQLSHTRKTMVRVHASGDFYSIDYINAWYEIAKQFPNIKFWTYTKTRGYISKEWDEALDRLESLDNFNIVDSMPCGRRNFGDVEYIETLSQEIENTTGEKPYICPCGTDDTIKCGKGCTACANCKYVLFHQH